MKRGLGIAPHPSEKHLPEVSVRRWRLDTSGVKDLEGNPLKRMRWDVEGLSRSVAISVREHRISRMIQGLQAIDSSSEERFFRKAPAVPAPVQEVIIEDATPRLADYVQQRFLPWARGRQAPSTVITKERILDRHILPQLGSLSVAQVATQESLQRFADYLAKTKESRTKKAIRVGYINTILAVLSGVLRQAAKGNLIKPTQVEFFKERRSRIVDGSGMEIGHLRSKALSPEDVFRLLETARNSGRHDTLKTYSPAYWYVLIGLGLYSGCRVGEACGRRWSDIDFETGTLLIASKVSSETDEFEPFTKNFLGGHIGLAQPMLDALRRLREELNPKDEDFILGERSMRLSTSKPRDWLSTRNLRDRYAVLTVAAWGAERENRNYHALRHTYATTMADAGVPLSQIQRAMRHAQLKQTMGYVHPRAGAVDQATKAIDYTPKFKVLPGGLATG
jgi:integrase